MRHYCSLADSKYLPQLLVLYESLKRHSSEPFRLYALTMDEEATSTVISYNAETGNNLAPVPLHTMTDGLYRHSRQLMKAKENRTWQEFCWTCASSFAEFFMNTGAIDSITYLDADMMFFSDPKVIFDEMPDQSIGIIPHRLIPSKRHLAVNGEYNVSWVYFKNDGPGRECLARWAAQVRERCSATVGCGDQLYLDEWPARYGNACHVIQNLGAGLAPWNLANYELRGMHHLKVIDEYKDGSVFAHGDWDNSRPVVDGVPVVFYHYHELRLRPDGTFFLSGYDLRDEDRELIYAPYLEAYRAAKQRIAEIGTFASQ